MSQLDVLELPKDEAATKREKRFRYVCGIHLPTGSVHVSDISTSMPPESFAAKWQEFLEKAQSDSSKDRPVEKNPYLEGVDYLTADSGLGKRMFGQIGQLRRSSGLLQNLEIQVAIKKTRPFVPVRIVSFSNERAYCKAEFNGFWLGIQLDRSSLESLDLQVGDSFEWTPTDDGKVLESDIRSHPRRPNPGEYERAEKAFAELAKLRNELRG